MGLAVAQAARSWEPRGIPIGSVLVHGQGRVVAEAHNERVQTGDPTAHAEIVCLRRAGRRRDRDRLVLPRIPAVVAGENRTFTGAEEWMRANGARVVVLDDERCTGWMQRLQREKPALWAGDIGR